MAAVCGRCDLAWVDEFIRRVRPYIFVREEDNLVIKRPNQAQKVNPQGARLLTMLLDGQSIRTVLDAAGRHPDRVCEIGSFLVAVKRFMEGTLTEATANRAVEIRPFDMRFSALPVLSEIAITYRCNLRCSFCYAGCNCTTNPAGAAGEMTAAEIRHVLERIYHDAKVPSVSFTGGEPTLRPELPALIAHAKRLGMRVNLITNGTLVSSDRARELAAHGLDSAQVSLEAATPALHDRITGAAGSFVRSAAGARNLKAAGIVTHTNTTLTAENLAEATALPRFVRDELGNDRFSMNLIIPTGSAALNGRLVVRYRDVEPHLLAVKEASAAAGVTFMWYSPTPLCMFNPIAHGLGNKGCSACDGLLSVAANGDVLPCSSFDEPVGNLLRQTVAAVWQSGKARRFRDKALAHPRCRECDDFALCHGACPLYWRHLGYGELEERKGFDRRYRCRN
jgi:radical SAM protein with 4Fe4S-binding SPASM domain